MFKLQGPSEKYLGDVGTLNNNNNNNNNNNIIITIIIKSA